MFEEYLEKLQKINILMDKISTEFRALWIKDIFITWRWWLCVCFTIISWLVWIKFRRKESSARLLFAGFFVTICAMFLDDLGIELHVWTYNVDIDPITPSFIMWDMSLLPVYTMFFLQYKPKINPFMKAIVYSGILSFVFQPLFTWLQFYNPGHWKHHYSFPIFILIYLAAQFCLTRRSFEELT